MEKDFEEFVVKRCENAKLENEDYLLSERGGLEPEEVQAKAEIICYLKGLSDAKALLGYLKM